jgi:hypothetical protein
VDEDDECADINVDSGDDDDHEVGGAEVSKDVLYTVLLLCTHTVYSYCGRLGGMLLLIMIPLLHPL